MTDTDLILSRLDDVKEDLSARIVELRDRVAVSNGRLSKLEAEGAVLSERIQTIQARGCARAGEINGGPASPGTGSWLKPAKPLVQGGAGAGIVVALVELAKAGLAAWRS